MLKYSKLITAILPKGKSRDIATRLWQEKKIAAVNEQDARRVTTLTLDAHHSIAMENEVLTVIVAKEDVDEVFEFIYRAAEIDQPNGSIMYVTSLIESNLYTLPDLPIES